MRTFSRPYLSGFVLKSTGLLLSAAALLALPARAQARRPMQFSDQMKMRRVADLDVSPDGRWVLFSVTDVDLAKNTRTPHLWLVATAGSEAQALTGSLAGESRGRFSPDGRQIAFLSARDGNQQIWLAAFDTDAGTLGEPHRLTSLSTEADGETWSPDSRSLLFTSAVYPDCPDDACARQREQAKKDSAVKARVFTHLLHRHWNTFTGDRRSHLFLVSAEGGAPRDLNAGDPHEVPRFSLGGPDGYAFAPDGKEVAFEEDTDPEQATSTNADIYTLRLDEPAARPVKVSTGAGGDFSPRYSPDGRYLAWRSQVRAGYESDRFRLLLRDRNGHGSSGPGTSPTRELMPNFDRWVDAFTWSPDSKYIYFTSGDAGEEPVYRVELASGRYKELARAGEYDDIHLLPGGGRLVATRMTVRQPAEIVALELNANGEATPLTHLNDALLAQLDLPEMERFWFTSVGKVRVEGFLIRPPGFDAGKRYPVKFLIHGGPQGAWGDSWSYRWNPELFAANGYAVVMINPRGSTGYGQAFTDGVNGDWGGKPYADLMRGLDYAEQRYGFLDKSRECALGASYGGYMANWILGHTDRFRCIVTHDGMFNPVSAYGTTDELWFNEWEFRGTPWENAARPARLDPYRRWSPMLFETHFHTPTLVIHGQLDYRLDVSEGFQLFTALQRLKVPSEMLYFPDEGHWVLKPQNSELWYRTVNEWVDRWTK